jgi:predicted flap endonuclease-1-like 5' DNA nuclease
LIAFLILAAIAAAAVAGAVAGYVAGARRGAALAAVDAPPPGGQVGSVASIDAQAHDTSLAAEKARIIRSRDGEAAALRELLDAERSVRSDDADLRREREALFMQLADAREDSARYRALVIDIENNAPPPILSGVGEPDDLKLIVGIGPVLERMLHNLGVTTFRQIARWSARDVVEFDARLPEFPGRIQRDQWVTQARALHESKYGAPPR